MVPSAGVPGVCVGGGESMLCAKFLREASTTQQQLLARSRRHSPPARPAAALTFSSSPTFCCSRDLAPRGLNRAAGGGSPLHLDWLLLAERCGAGGIRF